jgi:N-acetylglucosaminyldiphosphoundecaprenol N-acetyl-beta-D-mannosaminyltransferase
MSTVTSDLTLHFRTHPASRVRTRRMFGIDFIDDVDVHETVKRLLGPQAGEEGEPVVFTPNVDTIVRLGELEASGLAERLRRSRYVLPDGQPIVWLSRLIDRPLRGRLAGSDLVPPLWRGIVADGRRAMVVASSEGVADALRAELPSLGVYVPPLFDETDSGALAEVVRGTCDLIDRTDPEFVFLGISYPKQQLLGFALIDQLRRQRRQPPVFLMIGGGLNMYAGQTRRAPAWVRRIGGEWFFRFLLEPRRLFRRYFIEDVKFLPIAARELWTARGWRRPARDGRVGARPVPDAAPHAVEAGTGMGDVAVPQVVGPETDRLGCCGHRPGPRPDAGRSRGAVPPADGCEAPGSTRGSPRSWVLIPGPMTLASRRREPRDRHPRRNGLGSA